MMRSALAVALIVATTMGAVSLPAAEIAQSQPDQAYAAEWLLEGRAIQGGILTGRVPVGTATLSLDGKPVPLSADGRFLIGFDRDAAPTATLVAHLADGRELSRTLSVAPRAWRIENLNTLPRRSQPTEVFLRLRAPELATIAAARTAQSDSEGWRQRFIWPVTGRLSGLFGAQRIYRGEPGAYHSGVDVAAPAGTVLRAPADGVVTLATDKPFTLEGYLLMIDHGMGLNSAFLHLSRIDVRVGDSVKQGQPIAAVGATGRVTGPHMHWGMKWHDARIDPLLVAGAMP